MQSKNAKNKNYKKLIIILLVVGLLAGGALILLEKNGVIDLYQKNQQITQLDVGNDSTINLSPASEEDLQAAEDNKKRLSEELEAQNQQTTATPNEGNKTPAKPTMGFLQLSEGSVQSNGYISSIIEEGGTCTLTLSKDGVTKEVTSNSLPDAQGTVCGLLEISTDELTSGEWTATIKYSSDKYEGISDEQTISI